MTFKSEWQLIKKNFENATGKKKPSAKFLGLFSKGSGIGTAAEKLDACLAKHDAKGAEKALAEFTNSAMTYQKILSAAVTGTDRNVDAEVKVMIGELNLLIKKAKADFAAVDDASKQGDAKKKAWKLIIEQICKTPLPGNAAIKSFIGGKEFAQDLLTKKDDPKLKKLQAEAKTKLAAYIGGLGKVKSFKIDGDEKAAIKKFLTTFYEANDQINIHGGVLGILGQWRSEAAGNPAKVKAFGASKAKPLMDAANDAVSAENERLGILLQQFERQVSKTR